MPVLPTRGLGSVGIIKDVPATDLPPNAWSDGLNVRFNDGAVERSPAFRLVHTFADTVTFAYGLYNRGSFDSVLFATDEGLLYNYANGTATDYTEAGHVNNSATSPYTGCTLSGCN